MFDLPMDSIIAEINSPLVIGDSIGHFSLPNPTEGRDIFGYSVEVFRLIAILMNRPAVIATNCFA